MQPPGRNNSDVSISATPLGWVRRVGRVLFGLQSKATMLVVALILIVAVPFCGLAVRQTWNLTNRLDRERALQQVRSVAKLSAEYLAEGRTDDLRRMVRELATGDPLCYVRISGADNVIAASAESVPGIGETAERRARIHRFPTGVPVALGHEASGIKYWDVSIPIHRATHGGGKETPHLLGHVRLGLVRNPTIAEFSAASDLLMGIGIAVVLATIPLGFFVVRRIVVPLEEMSDVARRFSSGDMHARCSIKRADEVGELAGNLNLMAEQVARTHAEIVQLNADLEHRVLERTSQLRELASRDPLTGLYNRRHMGEVLSRRFAEARRYGGDLSLMMIDMDNFKAVNDSFGHQVGDELLILTALTISSQLRSADVAARFGGDEFIVLLPHSESGHAQTLGRRIAERFRGEVKRHLPQVEASLSIGIAGLGEPGVETHEEFIRAADQALYEAKALGRNRVVLAHVVGQ